MPATRNIFMYQSLKTKGLFCFSPDPKGVGLPETLSPWMAFGVVRPDQVPPHGLSRNAIETGIANNGYQLWREKPKTQPTVKPSKSKTASVRG